MRKLAPGKLAELKQKNGPKIRPPGKFVPRPTPPRPPASPPPTTSAVASYKLDDVFTTSAEDAPVPTITPPIDPSLRSSSKAGSGTSTTTAAAASAAAKKTKLAVRKTKGKRVVDIPTPTNPMNNPLDDIVPLGPAKKQKINDAGGGGGSSAGDASAPSSSSTSSTAPFKMAVEKHRTAVQAKRSKTENISKLENKPNLMLKAPAEKTPTGVDLADEDESRRKTNTNASVIKAGARSKASQLISQPNDLGIGYSTRAHSNSPTPPPLHPSAQQQHQQRHPQSTINAATSLPDYAKCLGGGSASTVARSASSSAIHSAPPPSSRLIADAPDISGSDRLNIWSIVYPMLRWNPTWLKEAIKATEPPPLLDRHAPPEKLKSTYEMFLEYHEIMHRLVERSPLKARASVLVKLIQCFNFFSNLISPLSSSVLDAFSILHDPH